MTLRDKLADISVPVTCSRQLADSLATPLVEGASVVIHAKPDYYANRGSLSLVAREIRMIGLGELLARLERRRQLLAAEGLFAAELKKPLPFLPQCVGLITAPHSAAERDVVENARRRWPGVDFETTYAAMQGTRAATEVIDAIARLDRDPRVDVIVIARGGGSVEDLLPFSDEALVRAVAGARTPVVSAIGHEPDTPLIDLAADVRASTPTDAAKRLVPDMVEELKGVTWARDRLRSLIRQLVDREAQVLADVRARPALADPRSLLDAREVELTDLRDRGRRVFDHILARAADDVRHQQARVRALSPLATLERGYAVVQRESGEVVTSVGEVAKGVGLHIRVADGRIAATTTSGQEAVQETVPEIREEKHG
jgi:exodeoxyribonuclease VII large subunit